MSDIASAVEQPDAPPPQQPPAELPDVDTLKAPPPVDVDSLKPAPVLSNPRGGRGGLPDSAALRFGKSDAIANIFKNAGTRFANGFVNTFEALNQQDQKLLIDGGYGNYSGPGSLLQHAADTFNAGATLLKNGFFALGPAITEGMAGAGEQTGREAGLSETEAQRLGREAGLDTEAVLSDVGTMHGMAMLDAAKAQAAAPGIWGHAYRLDETPPGPGGTGGGLTHTPLGRLPSEAEAVGQAATVAETLHLPASAADAIHRTYIETGRPPAEVLLDAQTNHGGVLDDLVAGKVPDAYQPPAGAAPPATPKAAAPTTPRLPPEPPSLLTYISRNGGVMDEGKELSNMGVQDWHKGAPFRAKIIRDDGMELDQMRLRAQEAGYPVGDDVNSFLDAIHSEVQGRKVYSEADQARVDARREAGQYENTPEADVARDLQALGARVPPDATLQDLHDRLDERLATIGARDVHEARHMISQAAAESEARLAGNEELSQAISEEDHHGYFGTETQSEDYRAGAGEEAHPQPGGEQVAQSGTGSPSPHAEPGTGARGLSKIGQSIEAKAVEAKLTNGFAGTAGYDKITIADQAEKATNLVNNSLDDARAVIRGDKPLPDGLRGTALITAMEDYIKKNPDADMAYELANSPLVSATSEAAQELRLAAERTPDSATAKLQEIREAQAKQAGGAKQIAQRKAAVKQALPEAGKVLLPKEELSWDNFLSSIKC